MLSICLNYDRGKGVFIVEKQILDITSSSHSNFLQLYPFSVMRELACLDPVALSKLPVCQTFPLVALIAVNQAKAGFYSFIKKKIQLIENSDLTVFEHVRHFCEALSWNLICISWVLLNLIKYRY